MKTVTLAELGQIAPIPKNGPIQFSFKPWRLIEEKKIGEIRKKNRSIGKFISEVFELMLDSFKGSSWDSIPANERKIILNQLPVGSMLYMYLYLRYDAMGDDIVINNVECPVCKTLTSDFVADLGQVDVRTYEDGDPETSEYELRKPIAIGDVKVTKLVIGYAPWDCVESANNSTTEGDIKESMIRTSIVGSITEEAGRVELDRYKIINSLSKRDIEGLYSAIDEHNGGPILGLESTCSSCGHHWKTPLNWSYDSFFGASSLSQKKPT